MEVVIYSASLKSVKIIISKTSLQERMRASVFYEPLEDISAALHHEQPQADVCGVRGIRYVVKKKRSTGGRRVEKSSRRSRICRTRGISSVLLLLGVGCNPCRRDQHV